MTKPAIKLYLCNKYILSEQFNTSFLSNIEGNRIIERTTGQAYTLIEADLNGFTFIPESEEK